MAPTLCIRSEHIEPEAGRDVTDHLDKISEPPYGPDDLKHLAEVLDVSVLSPSHIEQLQGAARGYILLTEIERKPGPDEDWEAALPNRSTRREALKNVATAARTLKEALEDRAIVFLDEVDKLPVSDTVFLDELSQAAERATERIPLAGADPKDARITFLRCLADIYEDVTGQEPTRRHDYTSGLDYGPFLDFAKSAITPFYPEALKGLEHDVHKVVAERHER